MKIIISYYIILNRKLNIKCRRLCLYVAGKTERNFTFCYFVVLQGSEWSEIKNVQKKKGENFWHFLKENTSRNMKGLKKENFDLTKYWFLTHVVTVFFTDHSPAYIIN